ncbi:hypothetical protein GCM10010976_23630 [Bizionia arctica]|uniref:VWFA domain-containing protein n=2 Tax=Bizionia arctica TaxID=1495645 RepID=A0A917GN20_9FLAO|nr:hypothetical protein GCM10010976_23630 [Bizionia arctica]
MHSIKQTAIQGFNEIVQTAKGIEKEHPEQEHFISLVTFNGIRQKLVHFVDPVNKLEQIDDSNYHPNASTPLFDAIGFGINKLRQKVERGTDYNVLVTILTDGEENSSKEYSGRDIKSMIEALKLNRWTFTYIGTDHDVEKMASSISINNTMNFNKNEADMRMMFEKEKMARLRYSEKIKMKEKVGFDFYENENSENNTKNVSTPAEARPSFWQKFFGN